MHYRGSGLPKRKSGHWLGVIGICIALLACVFAAWGQDGDNAHDENDIVHAHDYTDFEVNPDERVYSWHKHKNVRKSGGKRVYADESHHGADRNIATQNGDGHDGEPDGQEFPAITSDDVWHSHTRHHRNDWWCEDGRWKQTEVPVSEDLENGFLDRLYGASGNWHIHYDGYDKDRELTGDLPERHNPNRSGGYDCSVYVDPVTPTLPPQKSGQKRSIAQRLRESGASEEMIEEITEEPSQPLYVYRDPTCDTDFSVAGIVCHNWQITDRYQLIGFPLMPLTGIDTVGWLHYFFEWKLQRKNILFQVFVDERWVSYTGGGRNEVNPEVGDIPITPHLGILVNFNPKSEESIGLLGTPQQSEVIDLESGIHLIGLPEVPANFNRASDFLSVDGVEWIKIGYGSPQTIDSEDDPDDQDLEAGQAIRISVTEDVTLDLRGLIPETAAAPSVRRKGTLATSWGAMKRDDSR